MKLTIPSCHCEPPKAVWQSSVFFRIAASLSLLAMTITRSYVHRGVLAC